MTQHPSRRRHLLHTLAGFAVLVASHRAMSEDDGEKPAKAADPAKSSESKGAEKKKEGALLTVSVRGEGKPIAQAEVQVKFPPAVGGESKLPTGAMGEATFKSPAFGRVKVRVIATGWESALQEVELREASQRVTIVLKPKASPK